MMDDDCTAMLYMAALTVRVRTEPELAEFQATRIACAAKKLASDRYCPGRNAAYDMEHHIAMP